MRAATAILVLAVALSPLTAYAIDVWGDQWGTWTTDNSPYNVIGEITVPPESTLVIEPGVVVNFRGHYKFVVDSLAILLAVGTEADSIYFTTDDPATGWHAIRFLHADGRSHVAYCRLEYGKSSQNWPHSDVCGGAVYCNHSSPQITNNVLTGNWALWGGAIGCDNYSSPSISGNLIIGNAAEYDGGAICCSNSSNATIVNNTITLNSAKKSHGGGIYCGSCSCAVGNSIISENTAKGHGGGICCEGSELSIGANTVTGNSANSSGGGISCLFSLGSIEGNVISGNSAQEMGGGIYLMGSSPEMADNNIIGNSAQERGGGIYCYYYASPEIRNSIISGNSANSNGGGFACFQHCDPMIQASTISGNHARSGGGGVACFRSTNLIITNTILWRDSDGLGRNPEIFGGVQHATVSYSDVEGGWEGVGNIDADPLFAGPRNEDFHLRWHSPCINAGDPSLTDPDGTRSDIGAFYFNLAVLGIVELYPHDEPIVIPQQGGDITYDGGVLNLSRGNLTVDIWAQAFVPGLSRPHRLWRYNDVTIPFADSIIRADLAEHVPGYAPSGAYTFVTYIGDFPSSIIDSSCMYFTKEGAAYASAGGNGWQTLKGWFDGDSELSEATLPTEYSLKQNYPNPFNATTLIQYQLPTESDVRLRVYNTLGQIVATVVDQVQEAGYRSAVWDASEVSSGLYFYKLTAGDYAETKRMILVK